MPLPTYAAWPDNASFQKGSRCETPVLKQPLQQHQGVLMQKKPKKTKRSVKSFHDFFSPCGEPTHNYPSMGHPLCG